MSIPELASYITAIEKDASLLEASGFYQRTEVADFIGFQVMNRLEALQGVAPPEQLASLQYRAEKIRLLLEAANQQLFERLRATIRNTGCTGAAFKKLLQPYLAPPGGEEAIGYDYLDLLVNGLFPLQAMPPPTKALEPEMVHYQKTPARVVFEWIAQSPMEKADVFFDIGAGLGQVTILVHLLTGIKARGVEIEPAYCNYARDCAAALRLTDVAFIPADARQADYSGGTVFFMFTPFQGAMLQAVLDILRKESLSRKIKIITYGPCTATVASQDWLYGAVPADHPPYKPAVFHSAPSC